jgi:sigma-B regulation protein RsbU (phosphoserine phosphatase)
MYFIVSAPFDLAPILLRFCKGVGAGAWFSTSEEPRIEKNILAGVMSKFREVDRHKDRGEVMATDAVRMNCPTERMAAFEVQQRFLEHWGPGIDALDYSGQCRQMGQVGGDFYDFVSLPEDRLALAIGDASGKGFAAALMIANVQSSLRTATLFAGSDRAAALEAVNHQLFGSSLASQYATLFYGTFDGVTRTLHYVNAGHNPPMVIRPNGSIVWLETGGAPVGLFPDSTYEEGTVQLHPGDLIVAYTDGVVEALNPDDREWGTEGLRLAASGMEGESADDTVEAIMQAMRWFSHGRQTDDATVVVVRVH